MITIENLTFNYGVQPLFRELSAEFESGRIYGLLGKNGAGKTSLMKLICGLLRPDQNRIKVKGLDSRKQAPEMLQDLFFIPESFYLPPITIEQYRSLHAPLYRYFDTDLFYRHLEELSLQPSQKLNTLSYGLVKRFMLAFGLATDCSVLLLDEPTNGLDIPSKRIFRKLLAGSITKDRVFIIATHQIKEVENIFDHLMFIDHGRILFSSDVETISQKLKFTTMPGPELPTDAIYSEEVAGGYSVLAQNSDGEESRVDIEFLFNAVMESSDKITDVIYTKEEGDE